MIDKGKLKITVEKKKIIAWNATAYNWRFNCVATSWWRNGGSGPAEKAVRN